MKTYDSASIRKVAFASFTGTAIEWFDFFLYNLATALIFTQLFFPPGSGVAGEVNAYVAYAVGFLARPVGGMVCGHFGDRIGRKSMLVFALLITGGATFVIGLLPGYQTLAGLMPSHPGVGLAATLLLVLMRFAQGFGIGGEWGGAVLMAIEHSPSRRRGFYGSWPQMGVPIGLFLANVIILGVRSLPPDVREWAWRAPFLMSGALVAVGLYIRLSVAESPMFAAVRQSCSKLPLRDLWRRQRRDVLLAMGSKVAENCVFYIYTVFVIAFARSLKVGDKPVLEETMVLLAISLAALVTGLTIPFFGHLSDRFGRRLIYLCGAVFAGLFVFPSFMMLETGRPGWVILSLLLALALGWAAMYAPQASFFSELFDTRVRYSGASLGAQVATIFAGGLMPVYAVDLLHETKSLWPVGLIVVGMCAVTVASVLLAAETAHRDIRPKSEVRLVQA
ncbi:MAG TPA: MFS transporter [Pyrinomonadaceae bacterium]|jgi:MFS family permease|nr:MFS transporter [Pyrinomonadaceae bacterium]